MKSIKKFSIFFVILLAILLQILSQTYALNPHYFAPSATGYPDLCFVVDGNTAQQAPPFLRASNFRPGDYAEGFLTLKNCGTGKSSFLSISLSYYGFTDPNSDSSPEGFLSAIEITDMSLGESGSPVWRNLKNYIEDVNSNGRIDLHDLSLFPVNIQYTINPDDGREFYIKVRFIPDAGNEYQGDSINLSFTFTIGG